MKIIATSALRYQATTILCRAVYNNACSKIVQYNSSYYRTSQLHTWNKAIDCKITPLGSCGKFTIKGSYSSQIDSILKVLESNSNTAKVIIINGTSSVGKTTLVNKLLQLNVNASKISQDDICDKLLFDYLSSNPTVKELTEAQQALIKEDDIIKAFYGYKINKHKYQDWQMKIIDRFKVSSFAIKENKPHTNINKVIYQEAQQLLLFNKNIIIDAVLDNNQVISELCNLFSNYKVLNFLLYSSLEKTIQKCFTRNISSCDNDLFDFRDPRMIIDQYCNFYKSIPIDYVSAHSKVIERINKTVTKSILEEVPSHIHFLLPYLYDDLTTERYNEEIQKTLNILNQVNDAMMLSSSCDTFVLPSVSHDYIINCIGDATDLDIAA